MEVFTSVAQLSNYVRRVLASTIMYLSKSCAMYAMVFGRNRIIVLPYSIHRYLAFFERLG